MPGAFSTWGTVPTARGQFQRAFDLDGAGNYVYVPGTVRG